ncbi:hypothetical protein FGG08_003316 [Glutinoglossum americanum]|uniref:Large ribosomal subunit protein bL27m n=1 Tax=Glutinoglossum americanum TaxID=1670608 RepID=A0A9P8I9Z7_9PEZI|nr:hypothetical protein FGG08_003316 [Glutinoglossum americanum]
MLLPRLGTPSRALVSAFQRPSISAECCHESFRHLYPATKSPLISFVRHATHKAQGSVNGGKDGAGKRLGAKKSGEQYVIPGNIIFRQRGSLWFPGENCGMGRDHTIYATQAGYVKYYLDPERHPKRKYIGVVFERDQKLPLPRNSARRRRLGLATATMLEETQVEAENDMAVGGGGVSKGREKQESLQMRPGYMYRESNWRIGRTAEKMGVKVKVFKPGDRWAAWRKATARRAKNAERRGMRRGGKR